VALTVDGAEVPGFRRTSMMTTTISTGTSSETII
jgi:hypothetical protein